jgi:hypothetical protein
MGERSSNFLCRVEEDAPVHAAYTFWLVSSMPFAGLYLFLHCLFNALQAAAPVQAPLPVQAQQHLPHPHPAAAEAAAASIQPAGSLQQQHLARVMAPGHLAPLVLQLQMELPRVVRVGVRVKRMLLQQSRRRMQKRRHGTR